MQNMGEKAEKVTFGTDHIRAKTLSVVEGSLQVFKQTLKGDILGC